MQLDVGFGDVITPKPSTLECPTILAFPAPVLLAYPRETVIAEKLDPHRPRHAQQPNEGLLRHLASIMTLSIRGRVAGRSDRSNFSKSLDPNRTSARRPHAGFCKRSGQDRSLSDAAAVRALPEKLEDVVALIANFCLPVLTSVAEGAAYQKTWNPGARWKKISG